MRKPPHTPHTHLARGVIDDRLLKVLELLRAGRGLHLERDLQRAQQKRGDLSGCACVGAYEC